MNSVQHENKAVVFMYPDIASPTIAELEAHRAPRERLAGFYQLRERGWNVSISDERWKVSTAKFRRKLRRFVHVPSWKMIRDWKKADIIVIKDEFSLVFTMLAKLLGKKIVYLDTMFVLPKNLLRRFFVKTNLLLADSIISLSQTQVELWVKSFQVPSSRFDVLQFPMDGDFYSIVRAIDKEAPYIISIGRDTGRDFKALVDAVESSDIHLKLVTLPYLLPENAKSNPKIEIFEWLSYDDLFKIYSGASIAVIPIEPNTSYPSGIRAVMEAMLLGVPVIASYTTVLAEYFDAGKDLVFVEPGRADLLQSAITELLGNPTLQQSLAINARNKMIEKYKISIFVEGIEKILTSL